MCHRNSLLTAQQTDIWWKVIEISLRISPALQQRHTHVTEVTTKTPCQGLQSEAESAHMDVEEVGEQAQRDFLILCAWEEDEVPQVEWDSLNHLSQSHQPSSIKVGQKAMVLLRWHHSNKTTLTVKCPLICRHFKYSPSVQGKWKKPYVLLQNGFLNLGWHRVFFCLIQFTHKTF